MHLPADVSLPPQEDFLPAERPASGGRNQGSAMLLILCWKRGGVSAEKTAGKKTGSVSGEFMEWMDEKTDLAWMDDRRQTPEILFVAFRAKMLYCISDSLLFLAKNPL